MAEPLRPGDPDQVGAHRLLGRLGDGGQGIVYLGEGPAGRVAVKVLRGDGADGRARERLAREIAAARSVAPFCVARIVDADPLADPPYLVSEYVEGPSLARAGVRAGADLQRLAVATATALAAVHRAGVVHRDFKPGNVLLGPDGPRVIDFGIARSLTDPTTQTSQVLGTPSFMAPEQFAGHKAAPPADVFAWGCVMLYAATGLPPFGSDTIPAVMHRILTGEPDVSVLEEPLRSIVRAALAKDPAARPTMVDICLGLMGTPASEPPPTKVVDRERIVQRVAVGGAVVAVAVAVTVALVVLPRGATAVPPTTTPTVTPVATPTPTPAPTPTPTPTSALRTFPAAFRGTWQGDVDYAPGASDRLRLDVSAEQITEHYLEYRCVATSRLVKVVGEVATLKRATMRGNCPRNGSITLTLGQGVLDFNYSGHGENKITRTIDFAILGTLTRPG
ncbi:serine/threonine-protein kinase [Spongiactinospora rosea]|uniref:serine/threonine-protein kinase n=1 Tax=Spongiactinospora rosea TaxID=2248750 RepID=UPI001314420F|nr:serine/threonine-protein kinase [Spongiactinospora rosea]